MNIIIKKLRKNRSKIAALAVISAVAVVIILVSRVRVNANNSYGRDYSDKRYKNYTVTSGDTLWNIAKEFRSTVDGIARVNGIENKDLIMPGQKLYIPKFEKISEKA